MTMMTTMNPAARLRKFGALKAQVDPATMPDWMLDRAQAAAWDMPDPGVYENQAALYARLSWVYSAVSIVGQTCALQALNVKKTWGEKTRDIENHPFEMLLFKPNPLQSRFELLRDTVSYGALNGNSYWWLNRTDETSKPREIWLLPSWRVRPVPDGKQYLTGYTYEPGGGMENVLLPLWQVVHFKSFNPLSEFVGMSATEPLSVGAQADLASQRWSAKFYGQNNARLPGILAFKDQINNEVAWERIKGDVARAAETRNILLMRGVGDKIEWLKSAATQEEMQQLQARQFTKEEVYSVFAPGLASMLAINATEANSKAGKQTFLEMSIWPRLVEMAQKITLDVLTVYGKGLVAEFDDPRQVDRVLELQEQNAFAVSHTLDEIRERYYEDKPLGDERGKLLPAQIGQSTGAGESEPEPEQAPMVMPAQAQPMPEMEQEEEEMEEQPETQPEALTAATRADLAAWRRKSLHALKAGKGAAVTFESDSITPDQHAAIWAQLAECKSAGDVRDVFEAAIVKREEPVGLDEIQRKLDGLAHMIKASAWANYP